jgi:hypothetical protein
MLSDNELIHIAWIELYKRLKKHVKENQPPVNEQDVKANIQPEPSKNT